MKDYKAEKLSDKLSIYQSDALYKFTSDAVLLAKFVKCRENAEILEFGAGSGIITLMLSERYPSAKLCAVELQKPLFDMASASVSLNGLEDAITLYHGRLQDVHKTLLRNVDAVVCNPPYREVEKGALSESESERIAKFEVEATLFDVVEAAKKNLKSRGKLFLITRADRLTKLLGYFQGFDFSPSRLRFVYAKKSANAHLVLVEAINEGNAELKIEPPVVLGE